MKLKPSSCGKSVAIAANDLTVYISKTQPKMSAVTGAANRNSIFHVLMGCNGKQATFSNGKRNASHISRSLFGTDILKKFNEGSSCCFVIVRPETTNLKNVSGWPEKKKCENTFSGLPVCRKIAVVDFMFLQVLQRAN